MAKELCVDDRIIGYITKQGNACIADMSNEFPLAEKEILEDRVKLLLSQKVLRQRIVKGNRDRREYYAEHPEFVPYELDCGSLREDFGKITNRLRSYFGRAKS